MGREDWKMGMISDCYQLPPLVEIGNSTAVKTPPPLPVYPSPLLASRAEDMPPANSRPLCAASPLPPIPRPCPCPFTNSPPSVRSPAGQEAPQTLAAQGFPANAEKVQIPAFTRAKVRQIDRGSRAGSSAGRQSFPRSKWAKWAKWAKMWQGAPLVPSSCPPALLPSMHQYRATCPHVKQGEGQRRYSRFGSKNACQGIILDRQEYSCVRNYLQFGRQHVDMSTCVFYCSYICTSFIYMNALQLIPIPPLLPLFPPLPALLPPLSTHPLPCTSPRFLSTSLPRVAPSTPHRPPTAPCLVWSI